MFQCTSISFCCSVKFGKKIMYVNYLHELKEYLPMDQITIPEPVLE